MTTGDIKLHGYVTESDPAWSLEVYQSVCQSVLGDRSSSVRRHLVCSDHIGAGAKYRDVRAGHCSDVTDCRTAAAGASGRSPGARPEVRVRAWAQ